MSDDRPIGVFDSGVGGLTVLQALHREMPQESTIYLGDIARCPYGVRPQAEVREFAVSIADMLIESGVKMLVVACNTATAAAYDVLVRRYDVPVVGVIQPAVDRALLTGAGSCIGVVATQGTVSSAAYVRAIVARNPTAKVVQRSASWLVPLIERGAVSRRQVVEQLCPMLGEMHDEGIESLILGCTHFPLIRDIFADEVGVGVHIIDSAATTAHHVKMLMSERVERAERHPTHRLLVTGDADAFAERTRAMFHASPAVEIVSLRAGVA